MGGASMPYEMIVALVGAIAGALVAVLEHRSEKAKQALETRVALLEHRVTRLEGGSDD